jgi:AcrR family transcriptional regulator
MGEVAQGTRERLLEAARELFTSTGYHETTTPILASRAGVAEGTIYRHFPSKRALLNAAFQETQRWGAMTVREVAAATGRPVGDRLKWLGRKWLERAEADPAWVRLMLGWKLPRELDEASKTAASDFRQGLEHLIAIGKQEGSVRTGVVELWTAVWLTLVSFAVEKVASREWAQTHPHALATLDAAWEAIAWRPAPAPVVAAAAVGEHG